MQHMKYFYQCLPVLLLATPCNISATESLFSEEDFLSELPVVLTATRLSQPAREAPAATTIIDRDIIKASGAREIAELFRLVPGFMVSHDNGYTPIVTYHGLSNENARRMQVLVDGRSVYSSAFGGVNWTNLSLAIDDIERIEVIRGPNAATYGANAFLSTINIITRHSSATGGLFTRANTGSDGIRDGYLRYGASNGELGYRLTVGYNHDKGFPDRVDTRHVRLANFRSDYQLSPTNSLEFQLGYNGGTREVDSKTLQTATTRRIGNHFAQLRWRRDVSREENVSLQIYYQSERRSQRYDVVVPFGGLGRVVVDESMFARRLEAEAQHTRHFGSDRRLVWGAGIRRDAIEAPGFFGTSPATGYRGDENVLKNDHYRLFGNLEWHLTETLLFNAGAMWEKTDLAGTDLSPRIGINYLFNPEHSIRLTASRARRTPTLNEAKSNFRIAVYDSHWYQLPANVSPPTDFVSTQWVGNPDLESETITSFELGYMASLLRWGINLDIKLFREELKNLISIDETKVIDNSDYFDGLHDIFENAGRATVKGTELAFEYRPRRATRLRLSHSITWLDSDFPNLTRGEGDDTAPRQISSLIAMQSLPGRLNGSLAYYFVSASDGLGSGRAVPAHKQIDLRVGMEFGSRRTRGEVAAVIQNLLNEEYPDWRPDNLTERQQYVSVSLQFD